MPPTTPDVPASEIADRFCAAKGAGWAVTQVLGAGGTAPVFELKTPDGDRALKIYDPEFSAGRKGEIEEKRIDQQLALKGHACPSLVQVYEGGRIEGRLYLLMSRAVGVELEKHLDGVPRDRIRTIVHQVAEAAIFLRRSNDLCHRDIKAANVFISEDFLQATLLDISVIRNVHDPIGIGTDHDGMLPIVATARYSPPEYLFRLLEPSPELWHALTVYQLGALLHDLIMRKPLFQEEYEKATTNKYRFAWLVATSAPIVEAADVDRDLVLLASRALDKKWERRALLTLEDFLLDDQGVRRKHALTAVGLQAGKVNDDDSPGARRERVAQAASAIEKSVVQYFLSSGVRATHAVGAGVTDTAKSIWFKWDTDNGPDAPRQEFTFGIDLELSRTTGGLSFQRECFLTSAVAGPLSVRTERLSLADIPDQPGVESLIAREAEAAFEQLAETIQQPMAGTPDERGDAA